VGLIRRFIYKIGLRPRPGSIFYSPSRDLELAMEGAMEAFRKGFDDGRKS
jgi:hypothetical protein